MPRTHCVTTCFAITSLLLLAGCNSGDDGDYQALPENQPEVVAPAHDHSHESGPNGGHLIELGEEEEYHAELVFDGETRVTTIYILDGHAKSPVPIKATELELHLEGEGDETELMFAASPLESDGQDMSSRFVLDAENLPESIKDEEEIKGHLHIEIDGKNFNGELEHDHDHEEGDGHAHDDDKDDKHKDDEDKE
ncbi:MAG: hypothetical protein HON53_07245 [Planctomycetaceae bacterium]|nr:hypothetical protein [Planctomycetaceae bacterium]MBT6153262.1 hypothetical protein [Planctomycetaceae bacterium]MBT6486919.1 hypothetical protein [Planctomycetaceae bacterium]MBT6493603.1 hypothetical protein [Planctomycetaceae bacterium]